jgi:capsule polysaccharide modification protein KpsS
LNFYYNDIKEILPEYKIIIKEHPMDIWRINYSNLQKKYPNIIWIKKWNIWNYIDKSDYLICINSSIWLQALSKYKKVLTLWNNFYSNNPWVENLNRKNEFKEKLLKLKNKNLIADKKDIDEYINRFKKEIFINWSWHNFTENTVKEICEYIVK